MSDASLALRWKETVADRVSRAWDEAEVVKDQLNDLIKTVEDIRDRADSTADEIDEIRSSLPCDEGIIEFADGVEADHDECYSWESVMDTMSEKLSDIWELKELRVMRYSDVEALLRKVLMADGAARPIINDILEGFNSRIIDPFTFEPAREEVTSPQF